jgi:hypothetical protein
MFGDWPKRFTHRRQRIVFPQDQLSRHMRYGASSFGALDWFVSPGGAAGLMPLACLRKN